MKNYSKENYANYESFIKEVETKLNENYSNVEVTGKLFETGTIVSYRIDGENNNVVVQLETNIGAKCYCLNVALKANSIIILNEAIKLEIDSYLSLLDEAYNLYSEEQYEAFRAKCEANRIEQERLKAEEKFEAKKQAALQKLENLKPENIKKLFKSPNNYYEALGWMTKHTTSIRASMPDYMESWFVKIFGEDTLRYVVDSKKKTSGGFPFQWGLSCKISFDEEVSGYLQTKVTSKNKKAIDSVAFVWDLIENYGFTFGKKQDVEKIRSEVPVNYIKDFELGYNL